jgi:hypothetical protein
MIYDRFGVNTKNSFNKKPKYRMSDTYEREIYLSEYTPINREHHRRIRNCMVVSIGINIFLLLVMVMR